MASLKDKLAEYFLSLLPTRKMTVFDSRKTATSIAQIMTADEVRAVFSEAESGDPSRLFALYRDIVLAHSHLQSQFSTRKLAVLGDTLNLQPFDKKAPADVTARDACWPLIRHVDWVNACNHLLDSVLWPVAVLEKVYKKSDSPDRQYDLARLVPVPHDLLDFRDGVLKIKDTDEKGNILGTVHDADPRRYIIHRGHLLTTPDNWGGPMRCLVLWWLLGTMDREWWARFLDRYGSGFVVAKYPSGDEESRSALASALSWATKIGGLVITDQTEVELKQAATSDAGDAFEKFHSICNREMSKLILGQTTSSDAQSTGLGSSVGDAQAAVRQDIRQWDAKCLGATITNQLARQYLQINGIDGAPPMFVWGTISPEKLKAIGDFMSSLKNGGARVADEGLEILSEMTGLPLEREEAQPAPVGGNPFQPFTVRAFTAGRPGRLDDVARDAAATLSHTLGRHFAPVREIILKSTSPDAAIADVQAYCAKLDTRDAARIVEEVLVTYAANGAAAYAR